MMINKSLIAKLFELTEDQIADIQPLFDLYHRLPEQAESEFIERVREYAMAWAQRRERSGDQWIASVIEKLRDIPFKPGDEYYGIHRVKPFDRIYNGVRENLSWLPDGLDESGENPSSSAFDIIVIEKDGAVNFGITDKYGDTDWTPIEKLEFKNYFTTPEEAWAECRRRSREENNEPPETTV